MTFLKKQKKYPDLEVTKVTPYVRRDKISNTRAVRRFEITDYKFPYKNPKSFR